MMRTDSHPFLVALLEATTAHDLDALVDCFEPAYRNEAPAHPSLNIPGSEQVHSTRRPIFSFVPHLHDRILLCAVPLAACQSGWRLCVGRHLVRRAILP